MSSSGVEDIDFTWKIENCDFLWFETFLGSDICDNSGTSHRFDGCSSEEISVGNPCHSVFCLDIFACISSTGEHMLECELVPLRGLWNVSVSCEVSLVGFNGKIQKVPEGGVNVDKHFFAQETLTLRCRLTFSNFRPQDMADAAELKDKINKLFLSGEFSDLTLYTSDKEFFVHKFLLRKRAPQLLEDLGILNENCKIERVKVDSMSTSILQTFLQYIYSGKLDILSEGNLPELNKIFQRNRIGEYNNVIHLNKSATITSHLKVIRRIFCFEADANNALNNKTVFFELINLEYANFFIKVSLKITAQKLQIQTRILCLGSLKKDILMRCIISSGLSKNNLNHEQKLMLLFSASNSKQEHNFTRILKYSPQDIKSELHLQFNISVSKGRYYNSVDGIIPAGNWSIFDMCLLSNDIQKLGEDTFEDENSGDVTLRFSDGTLRGHKAVLAAWSPILSSMFQHDMKEKNSGEVNISDMDYDTGLSLLEFMYSGVIYKAGYEEDAKLYVAADKYQVSSLFAKCSSLLASQLTMDNACDVLVLADRHSDENLLGAVQKHLTTDLHDLLGSREWLSLVDTHPRLVSKTLKYVTGNLLKLTSSM